MSIASEITRLQQAKADIKTAIENKGVTVPSSATLDDYADLVDSISGGGGSVDWESIAKGMCDGTTSFEIPEAAGLNPTQHRCYSRKGLASVTIPSGASSIGQRCFYGCNGLESVTLPSTITKIEGSAFEACAMLTSINLENTALAEIGGTGFAGCSILPSVTIPSTITKIDAQAFRFCRGLVEVVVLATTPPTLGTSVFQYTHADLVIYVPDASVSAYQSATNWTTYASKIKGISERPTT